MVHSKIIKYINECYKIDNHGTTIWNIFEDSAENQYFFKDCETLQNGVQNKILLNKNYAETLQKKLYLYQKEKQLFYCSFFVIGNIYNFSNDKKTICSPLFFYPAEIQEENNEYMLSIKIEDRIINSKLVLTLINDSNKLPFFYEDFYKTINKLPIDKNIIQFEKILNNYFPNINTSFLNEYPILFSREDVNNEFTYCYQYQKNNYKLCNASVLAVLFKSDESRGISTDLSILEKTNELSSPLNLIFNYKESYKNIINNNIKKIEAPSVISDSQKKILEASSINPVTLVIGPPGTGKTYTIASLSLELLNMNESILISSKTNHPLDLIYEMITDQLKNIVPIINVKKDNYLSDCINYLENLLNGKIQVPIKTANDLKYKEFRDEIDNLNKIINEIESNFNSRNLKEQKWNKIISDINQKKINLINQIKSRIINFDISRKFDNFKYIKQLEKTVDKRIKCITGLIEIERQNRLREILSDKKDILNAYLQILKRKSSGEQINLFEKIDYKLFLKIFPVWLINTNELFDIIPLEKEIFDISVIDEATQCDIASCLPILFRSKKSVIVGDPKQLKHKSFLSKIELDEIGNRNDLTAEEKEKFNYQDKSILDLIYDVLKTKESVMFLNEHFRSVPQIINFSNQEFYDNSLIIKSEVSSLYKENYIEVKYCDGEFNSSNKNYKEALLLVDDIVAIIENEKHLDNNLCHSIGILSPFRNQINIIFELLTQKTEQTSLKRHNVLAGTAHTFQGDERDVMFISFALDKNSHPKEFVYLNKPDVFNVSITRARSAQYVYSSIKPEDVKENSLIKRYLENINRLISDEKNNTSFAQKFLDDVKKDLNEFGIKVFPAFSLSGLKIDLVIEFSNKYFGIDLIGFPGIFNAPVSVKRYKQAHRSGLTILPVTYSNWYLNKNKTIKEIQKFIGVTF